jgi:uncharacterized membrane protein
MSTPPRPNGDRIETAMGWLLQAGVSTAAAIVTAGGMLYLLHHGGEKVGYHVFQGEPAALRSFRGIGQAALEGRARGIIQLGLLCLIATPMARVVFSIYAFTKERDWLYVLVTLIVLAVLLFGLVSQR